GHHRGPPGSVPGARGDGRVPSMAHRPRKAGAAMTGIVVLPDGCEPVIYGHKPGCACPRCAEHRGYLLTREARQRGKNAAEQGIIDQAHREAYGRAVVTRELAGYGAYPY